MCGYKENFNTINKIDRGCIRFGDTAKGEVIGFGTITFSSSCDLVEVSWLKDSNIIFSVLAIMWCWISCFFELRQLHHQTSTEKAISHWRLNK